MISAYKMAVANEKIIKAATLADGCNEMPNGDADEEFNLQKIAAELLLESKAVKDYELFSKIALAGFWISLLLVIVDFMKV